MRAPWRSRPAPSTSRADGPATTGDAHLISRILASHPDAVVAVPPSLPRRAWASAGEADWYQADPTRVEEALELLHDQGVETVVVVTGPAPSDAQLPSVVDHAEYVEWQGVWVISGSP